MSGRRHEWVDVHGHYEINGDGERVWVLLEGCILPAEYYAEAVGLELLRLSAEKERLREAAIAARDALRFYERQVFGASNFTDRHDDEGKCRRLADILDAALGEGK